MADVSVRPARPGEAAAVARVQLATWHAAYADVLPADALALDPADVTAAWEQALAAPPSPYHRVLVALEGDEVVGLASCEPAPDDDLEEAAGELAAVAVELNGMADRLEEARRDLLRQGEERLSLERRLLHAEKLAEVGRLAAGLAHEIGAPLHVMRGRADLVARAGDDAGARQHNLAILVRRSTASP
jgi:signal transduction histidine kinase